MTQAVAPAVNLQALVAITCDRVNSPHSRRMYAGCLARFLAWAQGQGPLSRPLVQAYRAKLIADGLKPASVNLALASIKALANEAHENGWLTDGEMWAITRIKNVPVRGRPTGNWITREQTLELLCLPDQATSRGRRDFALLSLLVGCGLRRAEALSIRGAQVQHRDGRMIITDLVGKGGRVRTVPIPRWAWGVIDRRTAQAEADAPLLGSLCGDHIRRIVRRYGRAIGVELRPHDLRRTFAKLALKGGANLEQISVTLGHANIATTSRYIGRELDLERPVCDFLEVA